MSPRLSNAVRYVSVLSRTAPCAETDRTCGGAAQEVAAGGCSRTLSSRRIRRQTMPEAVVPYLRMSGRWLEEHGFAIGADVQVVVEQSRVTLISRREG